MALPPVTTASAARVSVGQRLALAVLAGVFVGDDDGLDALQPQSFWQFMIRSVSGLPKPSCETMTPSRSSNAAQLCSPVGGTLFVSQIDVFVGDDDADKVQASCRAGRTGRAQRGCSDGDRWCSCRRQIRSCRETMAPSIISVGLRIVGKGAFGIDAVHIGVMQQALALQHLDIGHARQVRDTAQCPP